MDKRANLIRDPLQSMNLKNFMVIEILKQQR